MLGRTAGQGVSRLVSAGGGIGRCSFAGPLVGGDASQAAQAVAALPSMLPRGMAPTFGRGLHSPEPTDDTGDDMTRFKEDAKAATEVAVRLAVMENELKHQQGGIQELKKLMEDKLDAVIAGTTPYQQGQAEKLDGMSKKVDAQAEKLDAVIAGTTPYQQGQAEKLDGMSKKVDAQAEKLDAVIAGTTPYQQGQAKKLDGMSTKLDALDHWPTQVNGFAKGCAALAAAGASALALYFRSPW